MQHPPTLHTHSDDSDDKLRLGAVRAYLTELQDRLCRELEGVDGDARFVSDVWSREDAGGGDTRILESGAVFERAGVSFSNVKGKKLPPSASAHRSELAGHPFEAMGVSLVIHPRNPHVPTSHANVRFLVVRPAGAAPVWWFGGGFDLTPFYPHVEDVVHWHRVARDACTVTSDPDLHARLKDACDRYFLLRHRHEARGVGGLFFDDFSEGGFESSFALMRSVGDRFADAYLPIVRKRKDTPWTERERAFQLYRRGRYVEFNLVWDRGTLFGLQSGGRTESILMSMPPHATWAYDWKPEPGSPEERLYTEFLPPRDWLATPLT